MNHKKLLPIAAAASLLFAACNPHLETTSPNGGKLDFSRYVAVGNSLTAGYADGSLYRSGQMNAYPALLSYAFSRLGPSDYKAPLLPGEAGWPIDFKSFFPRRVLGTSIDCQGVTSLGPVFYSGTIDTAGSGANVAAQGPYNNLGVPGIRAIDFLVPGYALFNPYAARLFTNPLAAPITQITRIQPTFFTAWIGNNDVLGYATSGGSGKSSGGTFLDLNSISNVEDFAVAVDSVLNRLSPDGTTPGAVINIPDVTAIPYFTTVPYNKLVLTRQGQVDSLNLAYQISGITFSLGDNPFIIQDNSVPFFKLRKIRPGEYITLTVPQDSLKCGGWGSRKPIPAQYVLDANEVLAVQQATTVFNGILRTAALKRGLAYVDINAYLKTITSGVQFNGVTFNTTFIKGGAFSLDGVHLTPRGNALVANEILRTINYVYGVSLPMVDVNAYNGVAFP